MNFCLPNLGHNKSLEVSKTIGGWSQGDFHNVQTEADLFPAMASPITGRAVANAMGHPARPKSEHRLRQWTNEAWLGALNFFLNLDFK